MHAHTKACTHIQTLVVLHSPSIGGVFSRIIKTSPISVGATSGFFFPWYFLSKKCARVKGCVRLRLIWMNMVSGEWNSSLWDCVAVIGLLQWSVGAGMHTHIHTVSCMWRMMMAQAGKGICHQTIPGIQERTTSLPQPFSDHHILHWYDMKIITIKVWRSIGWAPTFSWE